MSTTQYLRYPVTGSSSIAFDAITSGTNTTAAMVIGSGASLSTSGTGTITANAFLGILPIANGGTGSATQNFVDLTTSQTVGGAKIFTSALRSNVSLILEDPGAGTNTITLQAPTLSGSYSLTLPVNNGTSGFILQNDGTGVTSWVANTGGAGTVVGTFDSGTPSADGAHVDSGSLIMQSASATNPGLMNISTQSFTGTKTFLDHIDIKTATPTTGARGLNIDFKGQGVSAAGIAVFEGDSNNANPVFIQVRDNGATNRTAGLRAGSGKTGLFISNSAGTGTINFDNGGGMTVTGPSNVTLTAGTSADIVLETDASTLTISGTTGLGTLTGGLEIQQAVVFNEETNAQSGSTTLNLPVSGLVIASALGTMQGITAPAATLEQFFIFNNNTGGNVTISNQNGTATAANRIITGTGSDVTLANDASARFIYSTTRTRWLMC